MHYDGLSRNDDPVFVTWRTELNPILLAKEEHEKRNDRHIFQHKLEPKSILRHRYYRSPCYFKFTETIRQKRADSINKSIHNSNSIDKKSKYLSTKTTTKKVTKIMSPVKKP